MIQKIDIKEVERNLPSGTPNKIRGLDSSGNMVSSTLKEVASALPRRKVVLIDLAPGDTYSLSDSVYQTLSIYVTNKHGIGCIALIQWTDIYLIGDSLFKNKDTPAFICVYNATVGNPIIKNNTVDTLSISINYV